MPVPRLGSLCPERWRCTSLRLESGSCRWNAGNAATMRPWSTASEPGSLYFYRLDDDKERPDPASRFQPQGVHGPSQVMEPCFRLGRRLLARPAAGRLRHLRAARRDLHARRAPSTPSFPTSMGSRSWASPPSSSCRSPSSRATGTGATTASIPSPCRTPTAGPRASSVWSTPAIARAWPSSSTSSTTTWARRATTSADFGPYFTDRYRTPWGPAVNFDGPGSDEVRRFFIENALYWITEFHIDALRLDALHAVFDYSAQPFLEELAAAVHEQAERWVEGST